MTQVQCSRIETTSLSPKLYDTELGPEDSLPSPPTDMAYTLGGTMPFFEAWVKFEFTNFVLLLDVTLHYYCTGTPPQIRLVDASNVPTLTVTPSCGDSAHRHSVSFNMSSFTKVVFLSVKSSGGWFYLTEVQFFNDLPESNEGTIIHFYNGQYGYASM